MHIVLIPVARVTNVGIGTFPKIFSSICCTVVCINLMAELLPAGRRKVLANQEKNVKKQCYFN